MKGIKSAEKFKYGLPLLLLVLGLIGCRETPLTETKQVRPAPLDEIIIKDDDLAFNRDEFDFGQVPIYNETLPLVLTLRNKTLTEAINCNHFFLTGNEDQTFFLGTSSCTVNFLTPGQGCGISVIAYPRTVGPKESILSMTCLINEELVTASTKLKVEGIGAQIEMSPDEFDYGDIEVKGLDSVSENKTFTVINVGLEETFTCNVPFLSGFDTQAFELVSSDCNGKVLLPQGDSCEISVRATPRQLGIQKSTLNLSCFTENDAMTMTNGLKVNGTNTKLSVEPRFPINATSWLDYLEDNNNDDTCNNSSKCIHGGQLKKVVIPDVTSCTNLEMSDALDIFEWECSSNNNSTLFYNTKLKPNKGLTSLLDGLSWKENYVTLSGNAIGKSDSESWWDNSIVSLPDNSGQNDSVLVLPRGIDPEGTIYVFNSNRYTSGININSDKTGLVGVGGSSLTYIGNQDNCNSVDGEITNPDAKCVVSIGDQSYIWLEVGIIGSTEDSAADTGLFINKVTNSTFVNLKSKNNQLDGVHILGTTNYNDFSYIETSSNGRYGFYTENSTQNHLWSLKTTNNVNSGLMISNSNQTILKDIVSSNNLSGVSLEFSNQNVIQSLVSNNNDIDGMIMSTSDDNTITMVVTANNQQNGITLDGSAGPNIFFNVVGINNGMNAIDVNNSDNFTFGQLVLVTNSQNAIDIDSNSSNGYFIGNLILGSNGLNECNILSSSITGVVDVSGVCGKNSGNITITNDVQNIEMFLTGPLLHDDLTNADDNPEGILFSSIDPAVLDWGSSDYLFESWGIIGTNGYPNSSFIGKWDSSDEKGGLYNWYLPAHSPILNRSYDGINLNGNFVDGQICPNQLDGDNYLSTVSPVQTFLQTAYEPLLDGKGDDDGLCESSDEVCIYQPNFGVDQGQKYPLGECTFVDGLIGGISIFGYEIDERLYDE